MPKLSTAMREGKIVTWLKKEGDYVEKGEPICTIETEKAILDIEAPASGMLRKIMASAGETIPISVAIALLGETNDQVPDTP